MQHIEDLKQKGETRIHVTTVARSSVCPFQSFFYSRMSPFKPKTSKALITGTISHLIFERIYEPEFRERLNTFCNSQELLSPTFEHNFKIALLKDAILTLRAKEPNRYKEYLKNRYEHDTEVLKYASAFFNYVKHAPIPYNRELYLRKGVLTGTIDRIDITSKNKVIISDYKTSKSKLHQEYLNTYFLQLGGYVYLLKGSRLMKNKEFGVPQLIVLKNRSFEIIKCEDWMDYEEDFIYLLEEFAEMILKLAKGKKIKRKEGNHCYYCLAREYCKYYKRTH